MADKHAFLDATFQIPHSQGGIARARDQAAPILCDSQRIHLQGLTRKDTCWPTLSNIPHSDRPIASTGYNQVAIVCERECQNTCSVAAQCALLDAALQIPQLERMIAGS